MTRANSTGKLDTMGMDNDGKMDVVVEIDPSVELIVTVGDTFGKDLDFDSENLDPVSGKLVVPVSWTRYLYCRNDPVNRFDPDGMDDFLILVGDPGLTEHGHNVGRNFERLAETRASELVAANHTVRTERVSSVPDMAAAMSNGSQLDGGLIYYGHGGEGSLSPGEQSGVETNLQMINIDQLPTDVLTEGATAELHGCNTAVGGEDSIAQQVANQLGVTTSGYTRGMEFTDVPGQMLPHGSEPPATGSLYPVTAGNVISVQPNPQQEGTN
ncbi:hypothetical protein K8T06_01025 [bacterium]|nr:hypothetical protein [bacterium]